MDWRREASELNYRRFFAVSSLAGIRVEDPAVFDESHAEILRWMRDGLVDGLRVDHPDGLADPGRLPRPARRGDGWRLRARGEDPRARRDACRSTGRPTARPATTRWARSTGCFVDPAGEAALDALDEQLRGSAVPPWQDLIHDTKRTIADTILRSEVLRLDRLLDAPVDCVGRRDRRAADRASRCTARICPTGAGTSTQAAADARRRRPELAAAIDHVLARLADPAHPMAVRFQQTSGMVMAKGVEDTAFYRYTRLGSLTEVGGDPSVFALDVEGFHDAQARRLAERPAAMTALSTHDTKRGEDVRARIAVLAELPERWAAFLALDARGRRPPGTAPSTTCSGRRSSARGPPRASACTRTPRRRRARPARPPGGSRPTRPSRQRMHAVVDAAFDDPARGRAPRRLRRRRSSSSAGATRSAAKLLQLTAPGVPDVYQGSELWETSLVDPDNRRAVDFAERRGAARRARRRVAAGCRCLCRREAAGHLPRPAAAPRPPRAVHPLRADDGHRRRRATTLVAFDRGGVVAVATRLPAGLAAAGPTGSAGATPCCSATPAPRSMCSPAASSRATSCRVAELLERYPVALLAPADAYPGRQPP